MKRCFLPLLMLALLLSGCYAWLPEPGTEVSEAIVSTVPSSPPPTQPSTAPETEPETQSQTPPLPEPLATELVEIAGYIPDARIALVYATEENFTGQVIYDFTDAYLRYGTLRKLVQAAEVLRERGYGIVIWDAYRPVAAQQSLWDICPDPNYVSPPGTGTQSHCRGCAVDITLYDLETGALLEMPTGFDDFTALADRDYSDVSENTAANASFLEEILSQAGFTPYFGEWWHFTDTDIADYDILPEAAPTGVAA